MIILYTVQSFLPRKKQVTIINEELQETYGFLLFETENQVRKFSFRELIYDIKVQN